MVARGDVWWYESPAVSRRPFLILTRDEALPVLKQVLAVPATRTARDIPSEVALDASDGMPTPCVLSLDNITVIRPALCTSLISRLGPEAMARVCQALRHATAC